MKTQQLYRFFVALALILVLAPSLYAQNPQPIPDWTYLEQCAGGVPDPWIATMIYGALMIFFFVI